MKKYIGPAAMIAVFEAISSLIGLATRSEISGWYQALAKPPLNPPDWLFPVMWTVLYALIALAGWVIIKHRASTGGRRLLLLFGIYMAFNWTWSFVFFIGHQLLGGVIWISIMNILTMAIIGYSWRTLRPAALLMLPPLFWTLFAMYLNTGVWLLN